MKMIMCESFKTQKDFKNKLKELISKDPLLYMDVRPIINIKSKSCLKNFNTRTSIKLNYENCMLVYDDLGFSILVDVGSLIGCIFNNLNIIKDVKSDLVKIKTDINNIRKVFGNILIVEQLERDMKKLAKTINDKFDSNNYEYKEGDLKIKKHD